VLLATNTGQCVSVNQMISTQVGFIAQLKGTLTKKCCTAATVFVKHYSRLKYIHLMTSSPLKNNGSQRSLQTLCRAAQRLHPPLPLRQRTICRQRLQEQLQCKGVATHLVWGQHPLPKWHFRESHQRSLKECTRAAPPCVPTMAGRHPLSPLAICS
jgi:hypothetical protein